MTRVLITGAAAGIGAALAEHYLAAGAEVVGIDVAPCAPKVRSLACELSEPRALEALLATLAEEPEFDIVVHNAGINVTGAFEKTPIEAQMRVIAINLTAPLLLTAGLLKAERLARGGTLAFVSSLSHQVGYPGAAVYAASKDGLTHYARSLAVTLGPIDANVLTVFPGPTRTAQAREASPPDSDESARMDPAVLAASMARAIHKRQRTLVPGLGNKVFAFLGRNLPRLTERGMRKAIYEKLP